MKKHEEGRRSSNAIVMPPEEKHKYVAPERRTREQVEAQLGSNEAATMVRGLLSATYYDPDWRWVQAQCLVCLTDADAAVRRTAAHCLGLLAVFHQKLDVELVTSALRKVAQDPEVRASAEDSLADIEHTMGRG